MSFNAALTVGAFKLKWYFGKDKRNFKTRITSHAVTSFASKSPCRKITKLQSMQNKP